MNMQNTPSGDVNDFVPEHVDAGTIFWNVELAALRQQQSEGKVGNIYVHTLKPEVWAEVNLPSTEMAQLKKDGLEPSDQFKSCKANYDSLEKTRTIGKP